MKKYLVFVLFLACLTAFGQETQTRNLASFTRVKVAEGIDVFLKKGDKESARVEVTGESPDVVLTEVSGPYLKIHMKSGSYHNVNAKVYVTYVNLQELSASSAGSIFSESTIKSERMDISASSAGSIEVSIDAGTLEVSASSAADIELKGKAKTASFEASSAGEVDAYDLEAETVEADASSAGSVKLSVSRSLNAQASSGGSIKYRGNPDRSITNSSSGGSVKKSN